MISTDETTSGALASLLVFLRVAAFVAFLPPFTGQNIPRTVKVGLAVALSLFVGLRVVPVLMLELNPQVSGSWLLLGWLGIRETILGASLAWILSLVLIPIRIAGAYMAQEMGLNLGEVTAATSSDQSSVLGTILEIAAVLFLFGASLDHQFLRALDATFTLFPVGRPWELPGQEWIIQSYTHVCSLGLAIAAPLGILLFAGLFATLVMMRQNPQFNLFNFGTPVRLLLGILGLLWFLPAILSGMANNMKTFTNFSGL